MAIFFPSGYGHIAPKTAVAKIVTIFYAILGIPLTVLCWSNIGDAMANAFRYDIAIFLFIVSKINCFHRSRFTYWRIFCYLCTRKPRRDRKRRLARHRSMQREYVIMLLFQPYHYRTWHNEWQFNRY